MSYSYYSNGTVTEQEKQWEQFPQPPDDQMVATVAAFQIFADLEPYWEILLGEKLSEESNFSVNIRGHRHTPGTAKGSFTISININE